MCRSPVFDELVFDERITRHSLSRGRRAHDARTHAPSHSPKRAYMLTRARLQDLKMTSLRILDRIRVAGVPQVLPARQPPSNQLAAPIHQLTDPSHQLTDPSHRLADLSHRFTNPSHRLTVQSHLLGPAGAVRIAPSPPTQQRLTSAVSPGLDSPCVSRIAPSPHTRQPDTTTAVPATTNTTYGQET